MSANIHSSHTAPTPAYFRVLALWGALFYALNILTTLKGDDITYLYYEVGGELVRVGSVGDFFRSLAYHYATTNGRIADLIARFFCSMAGKNAFDVVNAVMGVAFVDLLTRMTFGSRRVVPLLATLLFVLAFIPIPGETLLWLAGATNYLWATLFTLWLFNFLGKQRDTTLSAGGLSLLGIGSFIAGGMGEVVALAGLVTLTAWLVLHWRKQRAVALTAWLGYALGVVLLVSSPGFSERFAHDMGGDGSLLGTLVGNAMTLARRSVRFVVIAVAVAVLLARYGVLLWHLWRKHAERVDASKVLPHLLFWACMGVMLALGEAKKDRVFFVTSVVAWVAMMPYVVAWIDARKPRRRIMMSVGWVLAALCLCSSVLAVRAVWRYRQNNDAVEREIAAAPNLCVISAHEMGSNRWTAVSYYDSERYNSYHRYYCAYYGKRLVAFLRPPMLKRYQSAQGLLAGGDPTALRCETDTAARIYRFEGESFSLLPVDPAIINPAEIFLEFNLHAGDNRLTRGTSANYAYQGNIHEHNLLSFYVLQKDSTTCFVIPSVDDDVDEVVIPVASGKTLHFKRPQ